MSSLKIPDLNLFRGKRTTRVTHYQTVREQGIKMLQKSNKKDFLKDIKTEVYLQTYKTNLNHFISPTKHKQKAEQFLRNRGKRDQLLLRAISFPKSRYYCPNCFNHQNENQKRIRCQCEIEQKLLPIRREQLIDHRTSGVSRQVKNQMKQIHQITITNHLSTVADEAIVSSNPTSKKQISFIISEESQSIKNVNIKFQENKQNVNQQQYTQLTRAEQIRLKESQSKFRNEIANRQKYLQKIDIDVRDSRSLSIDFNDLMQTKKQYVSKSKEFINRLDKIIDQGRQNIHY